MADKYKYGKIVFVLIKPPSRIISYHKARNRRDHDELLARAKDKGYLLYYAETKQKDGKHFAIQPWVADRESLDIYIAALKASESKQSTKAPKQSVEPKPTKPTTTSSSVKPSEGKGKQSGHACPFCGAVLSSTSGRTLHVKSKHPDRFKEYSAGKR